MRAVVAILLLPALAEAAPAGDTDDVEYALAVNPPFRWPGGGAVAGSAYVAFAEHHAIRANVALYDYDVNAVAGILGAALHAEDEASRDGRITDLGLAWMYFPDRLWNGFTLEAGVVARFAHTTLQDENASPQYLETDTKSLAGRALVGWSWLIDRIAFVSLAVGVSVGRESGTETTGSFDDPMRSTHDVHRTAVAPEGFVRIGAVFGR